jgi:hypothetical protein
MDKKTAQLLIEETFNNSFNEEQFTLFAKNLLNDLEPKSNFYTGNLIWDDFKEHINTYKRIGKYIDPEGEALDVLIVEVKSVSKLERARTALRNFVIKHLSKFDKDFALVAFYSNEDDGVDWRFSFIKLEYRSELDEVKGKVKTKKEFTPAKRYSFLVGKYEKTHTAKNQLLPLLQNIANNPTIEELEAAFSIEKVTDEFFNQYKDLYIKLYEHFENDSHVKAAIDQAGIDNNRFTKKLLGQIVFLYFLQKKGWLGVVKSERWGSGKKRFVQELYDRAQANGVNFFKDKLQYLFYEALAKERDNVNSYYARFDCRIPFLNGGLFEADYDWQNANITIPDSLFRNEEKNKWSDIGTGVLDVFDRYNFTIKEDEPLDKEVAVDPEMLGKVFENMLDITERKSKGAFYTPREIVHYMCQESLIHYLDNALDISTSSYQELGSDQIKMFGGSTDKKGNLKIELEHRDNIRVPKKDIETFIREGHYALENDQRVATKGESKTYHYQLPESIRQHADLIDKKLTEIRICDPAIGSGAFPVGLLHELVNAQLVIKPHLSPAYFAKKLKHNGFKEHEENLSESRYIYNLKRHIIQESIYGVDIDASAIDIARLRLWLSLVVDEDDLDPIETLPNLDYKIVCGNSLIGLPDSAMRNLHVEKELEALKEQFYNITDETPKKALRQQINSKIHELLNSAEQFAGYKIDFDFKLFFSEVWREKGGFDVVIGNPPYLSYYGRRRTLISKEVENYFRQNFDCITDKKKTGKFNSVMFFQEKALRISNFAGTQALIIDVSFFENFYAGIKKKLIEETQILTVIKNLSSFENVASGQLIIITNKKKSSPRKTQWFENGFGGSSFVEQEKWYSMQKDYQFYLPKNDIQTKILDKISSTNKLIEHYFPKMLIRTGESVGVKESGFVIDELPAKLDKEIYEYLEGGKSLKGQYEPLKPTRYFVFDIDLLNKKNQAYREEAENNDRNNPKVLGIGDKLAFDNPKILVRQSSPYICASYTDKKYIYNRSYYSISQENSSGSTNFSLLYTLSILNSSVLSFYALNKGFIKQEKGKQPQIRLGDLKKLPIIKPDFRSKAILETFVQYVLFLKTLKQDIQSNFFIHLLDGLVIELYFPEEIKMAGKEILKHLGDLKPVTDEMSEEEKLAIIQAEFERLYDPSHPVRFAIETLDSVEEVRIIKEALK